jgi:hypothetical protein
MLRLIGLRTRAATWSATAVAAAALMLCAMRAAPGQNRIASEGWEGFAIRTSEDRFEHCVLYNRSIDALNLSQFDMLALTRDAAGRVGVMVFYAPRALTRGGGVTMTLRIDQHEPVTLVGEVPSDFHIIAGPLDPSTVMALREAKTIEATTEGHAIRFAVSGVGNVLNELAQCVLENGE